MDAKSSVQKHPLSSPRRRAPPWRAKSPLREAPPAEALAEFSAQARAPYGARKPLREAPTAEALAEQAGGEALALARTL